MILNRLMPIIICVFWINSSFSLKMSLQLSLCKYFNYFFRHARHLSKTEFLFIGSCREACKKNSECRFSFAKRHGDAYDCLIQDSPSGEFQFPVGFMYPYCNRKFTKYLKIYII